jgi:hypothetical protein
MKFQLSTEAILGKVQQDRPQFIQFPIAVEGMFKIPKFQFGIKVCCLNTNFGRDLSSPSKFGVPPGTEEELNKTIPFLGKIVTVSVPMIKDFISKVAEQQKSSSNTDYVKKLIESNTEANIVSAIKGLDYCLIGQINSSGPAHTFLWLAETHNNAFPFAGFNGVCLVCKSGKCIKVNYGDSDEFPAW